MNRVRFHYFLHVSTKYEENPTIGLGGFVSIYANKHIEDLTAIMI